MCSIVGVQNKRSKDEFDLESCFLSADSQGVPHSSWTVHFNYWLHQSITFFICRFLSGICNLIWIRWSTEHLLKRICRKHQRLRSSFALNFSYNCKINCFVIRATLEWDRPFIFHIQLKTGLVKFHKCTLFVIKVQYITQRRDSCWWCHVSWMLLFAFKYDSAILSGIIKTYCILTWSPSNDKYQVLIRSILDICG